MIFKAILSSKTHPECGVATILFPIPADQYDHTIELLETMSIGAVTVQDCRVDGLDSRYHVLKRLVTQSVNVDELDYLAKRLASFCTDEDAQFQAMASKLCLSDIKDFINLTFCCQEEFDKVDGLAVALDLIQSGGGHPLRRGARQRHEVGTTLRRGPFPQCLYENPLLILGVPIQPEISGPVETAWLYLSASEQQIARTLGR